MLSSVGENLGEVGTVYTAGESSHATGPSEGGNSAALIRLENACKGSTLCGLSILWLLLSNKRE